jgi:hypothetical protein
VRNERGAAHAAMALLFEELQKLFANFVAGHGQSSVTFF